MKIIIKKQLIKILLTSSIVLLVPGCKKEQRQNTNNNDNIKIEYYNENEEEFDEEIYNYEKRMEEGNDDYQWSDYYPDLSNEENYYNNQQIYEYEEEYQYKK